MYKIANFAAKIEKHKAEDSVSFTELTEAVPEKLFPPCIKLMLQGMQDGRKRSTFILINFLRNVGWSKEMIEKRVREWNKKNPEPLRENYILAQLNWNKKQKILPPNCNNQQYYIGLRICKPENLCKLIKNPVHFTIRKSNLLKNKKVKGKVNKRTN